MKMFEIIHRCIGYIKDLIHRSRWYNDPCRKCAKRSSFITCECFCGSGLTEDQVKLLGEMVEEMKKEWGVTSDS